MARDVLCILAAESGVKRVFSAVRDVCGYRRGQLNLDTIRAIMLMYYSRQYNHRQSNYRQSHPTAALNDVLDTTGMTEEQLKQEYETLREDMLKSVELQYISDTEPPLNPKVKRTYSKTTYQPFDPRRPHQQQDLSQATHRERQIRYHEAMQRDYADRQNPTLYEIPDDSTPRGNVTEQDEIIELTLPELEDSIV